MNTKLIGGLALGLLIFALMQPSAGAVAQSETKIELPATTILRIPLSHPISLTDIDSLKLGSRASSLVGYYFENDEIVGEYSLASGVGVQDFLFDFRSNFGTSPEVHAVLVEVSAALQDADLKKILTPIVPVAKVFNAPPATYSEPVKQRSTGPDSATVAMSGDWRPEQADVAVYPHSGRADFWHGYWWLGNQPGNIPSGFGAEFEVNLHNYSLHSGVRHACYVTPVGDYFWAKNYSWNWAVYRPDYATYPVATLGAYADYNDLLDPCQRNSMAIGMRYPQNIQFVNGAYGVMIWLSAPRGNQSSSVVSGLVQLVDDDACVTYPFMPYTDCMGLDQVSPPAGVPVSRITLAEWRAWTVPTLCWMSFDTGSTAPFTYSPCPVTP